MRWVCATSVIVTFSLFSLANSNQQWIQADNYQILEVQLPDRTVLSRGVTLYPSGPNWWVPLGQLTELLGILIHVSPLTQQAEGFILNPNRTFLLKVKECTVELSGEQKKIECEKTYVFEDEIYVHNDLLEQWLPIRVHIHPLRSLMEIEPLELLPFQLKQKREGLKSDDTGNYKSQLPSYQAPYSLLEGPFIDSQISLGRVSREQETSFPFHHSTQATGEVAGLDTSIFATGDHKNIEGWRTQLSRKDPEGKFLGPTNARLLQLLDVELPPLPLISAGSSGKGFLISSSPLENPTQYDTTNLEGILPPSWEVLVYRNGILLGRQSDTSNGRYLFRNLPMVYGKNIFHLTFFGPHGESKEEYRSFLVSPGLIPKEEIYYDFGSAFVENNPSKTKVHRTVMRTRVGLNKNFSMAAGFQHDRMAQEAHGFLGLTALNDLFLLSISCAAATGGGKACEWSQQTELFQMNLGARYAHFFQYRSPSVNTSPGNGMLDSEMGVTLDYILPIAPAIATNWEIKKRNFIDKTESTHFMSRLGTLIGSTSIGHEIAIPINGMGTYTGRFDLSSTLQWLRLRSGVLYSEGGFNQWDIESSFSPISSHALSMSWTRNLSETRNSYRVALSKNLPFSQVALDWDYHEKGDWSAQIMVTFSLFREAKEGTWHLDRESIAPFGVGAVSVFRDSNRNGQKDSEEQNIPSAQVLLNRSADPYSANDSGTILIPRLRPYLTNEISLSLASLKSPFLKPSLMGIQTYPRPGKTTLIDFPVVTVGYVDGIVTFQKNPISRLKLVLRNAVGERVKDVKTDRFGFYSFEDVVPGKYVVEIERRSLIEKGYEPQSLLQKIEIPDEGAFSSGVDFEIEGFKRN